MRINIYSQELILDAQSLGQPARAGTLVTQEADNGVTYSGVRMFLHSTERLHDRPDDDDRSAITFWLPKSAHRRDMLARSFEAMATMVRSAPPETGLD